MKLAAVQHDQPYTDEQRRAIETQTVSVSLSAGAGCGKTFVLTERFLAHFDPSLRDALRPEDLSQLVAITFTDRAAREMRDRIRQGCYQRLLAADPPHAAHWAALLRALDSARISTIHSFCAVLLRSHAVEAAIDPDFRVLEQAQADTLLLEVVDDVLRELIAAHDSDTIDLAARFDLRGLGAMVRELVLDCPAEQFELWRDVSPEEQVARWERYLHECVLPQIAPTLCQSTAARDVVSILKTNVPKNEAMGARRVWLLENLAAREPSHQSTETVRNFLETVRTHARVQRGGSAATWPSAEAFEGFKHAATALRKEVERAGGIVEFNAAEALEAAKVSGQLFRIADVTCRRYRQQKRELNALDFNDLLSGACALLTDPARGNLARRLSSQIRLLLVDEFQDTDALQVGLIAALCDGGVGSGRLFFVGDYKQSIYRFRGAKPDIFRKLREQTPLEGRQSLTLNFRSQPAILHFVNALFWDDLGEAYEPLRPWREQVSPTPAVEFLWAPADPHAKQDSLALRVGEADWIARRIQALVDDGQALVYQPGSAGGAATARPARLGDIAILFRALSDVEVYEAALRRHEIDYYVVGGHAFYAQQEIFDLLNLLRAVHSGGDAVSLVGALRSAMFSLTDESIFWLAQNHDGLSEGLMAADLPAQITPDQRRRVRFAAETIARLRAHKDRLRVHELIEMALDITGYDAALLYEFMGERKLANLRKLVEQARQFQRHGLLGLGDYIAQLAGFVVRQPDEALAATHAEGTNVVRLMTIHQAKGLEFPIVFVPDMDRPRPPRTARVHFDARLGPLVNLSEEARQKSPGGYELWRYNERAEDAAELNRLLYVATTRAADYLVLSGGVDHPGATGGPWTELLARRFNLSTGEFIASLPAGEPRPLVKVTTVLPERESLPSTRRSNLKLDEVLASAAAGEPASISAIEPIPPDLGSRRQYSFSRLSGALAHPAPWAHEIKLGEPADAAPSDSRGLGTLVHAVLASMRFDPAQNPAELMRRHALRHLVDDPNMIADALDMIERFAVSQRAREMSEAQTCHAEVDFLLAWPPGDGCGDTMLSGTIDRLYQDRSGRWHLLDFKTNRVSQAQIAELATPYEMQMLVYALAAQQILGAAPASVALHFLRNGQEYAFNWDAAARAKVTDTVNRAIAALTGESVA